MEELRSYEIKGYYIKTPEIRERIAFQVGTKLYKTKQAAANKIAWNWILLKYHQIADVKKILHFECDCAEYDEEGDYGVQYKHEFCEIHARKTGYFSRLHKKLVGNFLKNWERP